MQGAQRPRPIQQIGEGASTAQRRRWPTTAVFQQTVGTGHRWPRHRGGTWWAQQDSNLQPTDYEFVANVLCLGKSSIGKRKLKNKKVSCDSRLAQLDEGGQN